MKRISDRPCDFSEDDEGGAACGNRTILLGGLEIGADRSELGATKEGWRNEEGEAVVERVTYRFLCARFLRGCRSGPREVQAHSMQKPQGTAWIGRVEPVALLSLRSELCALVCLAFDSAAGVVDGRACGSGSTLGRLSYHGKGSFVLRWRRVPKRGSASGSLGTNRAYGDDTGEAGRYQRRAVAILGALGVGARSCWCVVGRVCGCACRVVTSKFAAGNSQL